jgi:hypothetical protein
MSKEFLQHQKSVLTYMFRVAPKQKGIIVAHYMGTGKTITAIGFLMQYINSNYKLTVVHPQGLKYIWKVDSEKLGIPSIINSIEFLNYDEFDFLLENVNGISDRIIVFDEAHKLASYLQSLPYNISYNYFSKIKDAHRILLLTGTPVYDNEYDLAWLINIAAGKVVIPLAKKEFEKIYYKYNIFESVVYQWTLPNITPFINGVIYNIYGFTKFVFIFVAIMNFIIKSIYPKKYYTIDIKKFVKKAGKYISFYDLPDSSTDANAKFPAIKNHVMKIPYNSGQLQVWTNFTMRATDRDIIKKILPSDMSDDAYFLISNKYLSI